MHTEPHPNRLASADHPSTLTIREMVATDQTGVRALALDLARRRLDRPNHSCTAEIDDPFASYPTAVRLVAVEHECIVGTGTMIRLGETTGEIMRFCVAENHQRRAIGRQLLDHLCGAAHQLDVRQLLVVTPTSWSDVCGFCESCGFEPIHWTPDDTWFRKSIR
jgi:GNAT superfamily N-acetyltransferase